MKANTVIFLLFSNILNIYANELISIGDLSGGTYTSESRDVNSDGTVIVGFSNSTLGNEAFIWTEDNRMIGLGDLAGGIFFSSARTVNADGLIVAGISHSALGYQAFRWTSGTGLVGIGDLAGGSFYSDAKAINDDGSVIVGDSISGFGLEAFIWTSETGMIGLGDLSGGIFQSQARAINSDGSVIVGHGTSASGFEAFRWTSALGMVGLGDLNGGAFLSVATSINSDGSVIAGYGTSALGVEAFKWTSTQGMIGLGDLEGGIYESKASGISGDGSIIVGTANNNLGTEAFIWTQYKGMQSLSKWLTNKEGGIFGWTNTSADGISADGLVIVGHGDNASGTEAFIAKLKSGLISLNDYNKTLNSLSNINYSNTYISKNIIQNKKEYKKSNIWISGNDSNIKNSNIKSDSKTKEIGFTYKKNENLFYTFYTGKTNNSSKLFYNGNIKNEGKYIGIETHFKPIIKLPFFLTISFLNMSNKIETKRGYENLGIVEYSNANAKQNIKSYNIKLQSENLFKKKLNINIKPFIKYNFTKVKTDKLKEKNGGFPVIFNSSKESIKEISFGIDYEYRLNKNSSILASLEKVSIINNNYSKIKGEVIDLYDFSFNNNYNNSWVKAYVGINYRFKQSKLLIDVTTSTQADERNTNYGLKYSFSF